MPRHCGRGIVENYRDHIGAVVYGVCDPDHSGVEEGRVSGEGEADRVVSGALYSLCNRDSRTHAETGVRHLERRGVSERVAADVTAEYAAASLHCLLDGVEGRAVRTSHA